MQMGGETRGETALIPWQKLKKNSPVPVDLVNLAHLGHEGLGFGGETVMPKVGFKAGFNGSSSKDLRVWVFFRDFR